MVLEQRRDQQTGEDDELHSAGILHTYYCTGALPRVRMYRCPRYRDIRHDRTIQETRLPRIPILYHLGSLDDRILLHPISVHSHLVEIWEGPKRQLIAIPSLEIQLGDVPNCDLVGARNLHNLLVSPLSR